MIWNQRNALCELGWDRVDTSRSRKQSQVCSSSIFQTIQTLANISTGIASGQITLLNVVKALGEYLTAEEDVLRAKGNVLNQSCRSLSSYRMAGVEFLSLVLGQCSPENINRTSGARYLCILLTCGYNYRRSSGSCHILLWQAR